VLTAELRHQVILDTLNGNTIIVNFDLTVISAETFTVGEQRHRLGRPGQKMTWTASGRPNTSTTQPGQFVFAGMSLSHESAPPAQRPLQRQDHDKDHDDDDDKDGQGDQGRGGNR
jgi:hypothetical protein